MLQSATSAALQWGRRPGTTLPAVHGNGYSDEQEASRPPRRGCSWHISTLVALGIDNRQTSSCARSPAQPKGKNGRAFFEGQRNSEKNKNIVRGKCAAQYPCWNRLAQITFSLVLDSRTPPPPTRCQIQYMPARLPVWSIHSCCFRSFLVHKLPPSCFDRH